MELIAAGAILLVLQRPLAFSVRVSLLLGLFAPGISWTWSPVPCRGPGAGSRVDIATRWLSFFPHWFSGGVAVLGNANNAIHQVLWVSTVYRTLVSIKWVRLIDLLLCLHVRLFWRFDYSYIPNPRCLPACHAPGTPDGDTCHEILMREADPVECWRRTLLWPDWNAPCYGGIGRRGAPPRFFYHSEEMRNAQTAASRQYDLPRRPDRSSQSFAAIRIM
jgi:hypothetical protein